VGPIRYQRRAQHGLEDPQGDPGSRWEVFEQSGHLPYFEEPDQFVRTVEGFLGAP